MKNTLILLFLSFTLTAISQSQKFQLTAWLGPNYSNYFTSTEPWVDFDDKSEIGYSIAIDGAYKIWKRLHVTLGLNYFSHATSLHRTGLIYESEIINNTIDPTLPHELTLHSRMKYLIISAGIKYYFKEEVNRIFTALSCGLNVPMGRGTKGIEFFDNGDTKTLKSYSSYTDRPLSSSFYISAGYERNLTLKLSLFLMPYFIVEIIPKKIWNKFYSFGVGVGIRRNL